MDAQQLLQILLGEFRRKLDSLQLVPREAQFPDAPGMIKVAVGMRRAGKTYFVYQHILKLLDEGVPLSRILYINFEDDRLDPLKKEKMAGLVEAFYSLYPENHDQKCYLFFDEVQNVEQWSAVVRRFHDSKQAEIYLTGSSAKLLSKEIATGLRGRSIATEIFPFSFHEFMRAKKVTIDDGDLFDKKLQDYLMKLFHEYLSQGGFPEVFAYKADVRQKVLQEYIDIVLYRDVIERHSISNPSLIKHMILSLMHNVSSPFAVNKFYNEVKSRGYKTGKDVLYDYVDYIEDTYLAFFVPLYDKSLRKTQANPKKVYLIDPGMVRASTLDYERDFGRLFENIVYLDLRRRGCKINYYLTSSRYEVDFVATFPSGEKKLFQVVWNMEDESTRAREERALEEGKKELKVDGEIITLESYLSSLSTGQFLKKAR